MIEFTPPWTPPLLIGLKIHPENPMKFDFLLDRGDVKKLDGDELKSESTRLIKYFLAALTVPAKDVWVNLSPYEKERIVSSEFGLTEMGRDLLGQDYILKQLMASLTYPEKGLGKTFWDRVYKKAFELYGATNIPLNTFNKVWIIPDSAEAFEKNDTAFVVNSHLKVMLEEDYLALKQNMSNQKLGTDKLEGAKVAQISNVSSGVVKDVLLLEIEREVNEGKNFALLRQIYNSLILAIWYKKRLKDSLLGQVYVDKSKVKGVDSSDPKAKEKIYQQYIEAFKQGVYNYIKEDYDPYMQKNIPRKYFSGGFVVPQEFEDNGLKASSDPASLTSVGQGHLRNNFVGKLEAGELEFIEIQVAELKENTTILGIKQAQEKILKWFDKRNEEFRKKKENAAKEPEPIPFTIDELIQAGLGEKDILQAALNNLKERGLVFERVKAAGEWDGKSWAHRFGISAASSGEFGGGADEKQTNNESWLRSLIGRVVSSPIENLDQAMLSKKLIHNEFRQTEEDRKVWKNLFHNEGANEGLLDLISGSLNSFSEVITNEMWQRWVNNLRIVSAEDLSIRPDYPIQRRIYFARDLNDKGFFILVETRGGKISLVALSSANPLTLSDEIGPLLYHLPNYPSGLLSDRLVDSGVIATKLQNKGNQSFLATSWIIDDIDKKQFEKAINKHPVISNFLVFWLKKGAILNLTGHARFFNKLLPASWMGHQIYRSNLFRAGDIGAFIHEFIHEVFDHLNIEQQRAIEHYFKEHHPEFEIAFQAGGLYEDKYSHPYIYPTEALAYYLSMALLGKQFDGGWGKDGQSSLVLKDEDIDFFISLGIITQEMKSKIKSTNLTEDHNIKLEEPGKGPGAGPIIEGPNNKVIEADDLIKQGKLGEAKNFLEEAIEDFQIIIDGNQDTNPNNLGYQMARAAKRNKDIAERLLQKIQQDQEGERGDNIGIALRERPDETKTGPGYGGIDLTAVDSTLQIKRDENGVPLPLPLQNIQNIHLDGLKFIILNAAPASFNDFPFLISLKEK